MGKFNDLAGQRFGRLTVLNRADDKIMKNGNHVVCWLCQCDCGELKEIISYSLTSGKTTSCGCYQREKAKCAGIVAENLTGQQFGKWTVLYRVPCINKDSVIWHCICDCGNESDVRAGNLKSGKSKSCGCVTKERCLEVVTKHGKSYSRLHGIWAGMKDRCFNQNSANYDNYGGRGIKVCDEWREDFQSFYDWAIKNGYAKDLSIDRIDVNGNYEPNNCRWATASEQMNNTRINRRIEYNEKIQTLKEWSDELKLPYSLLLKRLRRGWTFEKAISEPEHIQNKKKIEYKGKIYSIAELSRDFHVPYRLLHQRLDLLEWDVEKAVTTPVRETQG